MKAKQAMSGILLGLLAVVTLSLASVSCTKPRGKSFVQTQGVDLDEIAKFDNAEFNLTTQEAIGKPSTTKADVAKISIKKEQNNSSDFQLVKYQTEAKLLKEVPFVGLPNHHYKIVYRLSEKYLKVYKVGPEKDIPTNERPFAEKFDGDLVGIPLVGYPITYYTVETVKNDIGENTSKVMEVQQSFKVRATHFRLRISEAKIFEALEKLDVFPANFFSGEWYFAETLIAAPEGNPDSLGSYFNIDQNLDEATRVKFIKKESFIKAVNVNIDERVKARTQKDDDINFASVMTVPARWKDYRLAKDGNDSDLRTEEYSERSWDQRSSVELDLENASTELLNFSDGQEVNLKLPNKLVLVEISDDYFSFTVQKHSNNTRVRFSFLRVGDRNYTPKVHFEKDSKRFGYFIAQKALITNYEVRRKEDLEKSWLLNRFNPKSKEIRFYFTSTSPPWARVMAEQAVQGWNWAFKQAGSPISIVLDTSKDVELGDIRYNAINLVETQVPGSYWGLGPSVQDPLTGEIISAIANIHLTPVKERVDAQITNYVRYKLGEADSHFIPGLAFLGTDDDQMRISEDKANSQLSVKSSTPLHFKSLKIIEMDEKKESSKKAKKIHFEATTKNKGREFNMMVSSKNIFADIERLCPEVLSYIDRVRSSMSASGKTYGSDQNQIQNECTKKLMVEKISSTLVHEMGHNFGLTHNFMGSADKDNFWPAEMTKTKDSVHTSSVMEYPAFDEDRLSFPGSYDIEAIRYGYADTVKLKDGNLLKLDTKKSIEDNLAGKEAKKFKFCRDEDVEMNVDPFCQRFDAGVTPEEVVRSLINNFNASYAMSNYRFDQIRLPSARTMGLRRLQTIFKPMRQIYDHWRVGINRILGGKNPYLTNFETAQEFEAFLLNATKTNAEFAEFYKQYRPAVKLIYGFFKQIAMLPSKYCVGMASDKSVDLIDFESMRQAVYFGTSAPVKSCKNPLMQSYAKENFKIDVLGELGYFLRSIKFDLSPEKSMDPNDVVGLYYERQFAEQLLTGRDNSSYYARLDFDFEPNFLDEPEFREDWIKTVRDRLIEGVQLSDFKNTQGFEKITGQRLKDDGKDIFFGRFKTERDIIIAMFDGLRQGLAVPKQEALSDERDEVFEGGTTANSQTIESAYLKRYLGPGQTLVISGRQASFSLDLYDKLSEIEASFEVEAADMTKLHDELSPWVTKSAADYDGTDFLKHYLGCKKIITDDNNYDYKRYTLSMMCDLIMLKGEKLEPKLKKNKITEENYENFGKTLNVNEIFGERKSKIAFTKENFEKQFSHWQEKLLTNSAYFQKYRSEYEEQKNMIIEIFKAYPSY